MRGAIAAAILAAVLGTVSAASAGAQQWPAYGYYGAGAGFDYQRNVYSYPRPISMQNPAVPEDNVALYGGYLPNTYYSGAIYDPQRGQLFESGQAYCQTAGSYLYCANINSGTASLLAAGRGSEERAVLGTIPARARSDSIYSGVLATRTVGSTTNLVGTLTSPDGEEVAVSCSGPLQGTRVSFTCR